MDFFSITDSVSYTDARTETDSHANMVVLGKHCFIFESSGKLCDVSGFSPSLGNVSLPIVDAVIIYDDPYTSKSYLLMIRNALYVKDMSHNLIPPFLLREANLKVNECPKIHADCPTVEHHSIYFPEADLRVPLKLNGTFSFFHHRVPTYEEVDNLDVLFLTPDSSSWNPHSTHYAEEEEGLLDHEGNIIERKERKIQFIMDEDGDGHNETDKMIDSIEAIPYPMPKVKEIDKAIDETIDRMSTQHPRYIESSQSEAENDGKYFADKLKASVGSAIVKNWNDETFSSSSTAYQSDELERLFSCVVSSAEAAKAKKITPKLLSKLWCINEKLAEQTLNQNSHLNKQSADNSLSRQYSTNDRMIRYKRINSLFYTDTFFAKNDAKSTRGNTCMQIFVSDKGYVAVYPMKTKSEFKDCLHMFCKEIGVPETLVLDKSGEQTSNAVKQFSNHVGLKLRILEESTQWANRAELYIGLLKEAIRKDLRSSNCPLILWDYCAQRRALIHNLIPRDLFQNEGRSPQEVTMGCQGDISNLCNFEWYG